MSEVTEALKAKMVAYESAVLKSNEVRQLQDASRRALKEAEQSLFYQGTLTGAISGKNAETRDAEASILYHASTDWQQKEDAYRLAAGEMENKTALLTIAEMDLRVAVVLVNAEIAAAGIGQLITAVGMTI